MLSTTMISKTSKLYICHLDKYIITFCNTYVQLTDEDKEVYEDFGRVVSTQWQDEILGILCIYIHTHVTYIIPHINYIHRVLI